MRKAVAVLLIALMCIPLFAGSISYVYGNSISSTDFESIPKRGTLFTDDKDNVLAVRTVLDEVVVFDKLITRGSYLIGAPLSERGALNSVGVYGTLDFAYASYSLSTSLYPLAPIAVVGADYRNGVSILTMAGVRIHVCLANLWDGKTTLIQNGKIISWCAAGTSISDGVSFACTYGVTYGHNVGNFRWEIGVSDLEVLGKANSFSFCLGLGVDF